MCYSSFFFCRRVFRIIHYLPHCFVELGPGYVAIVVLGDPTSSSITGLADNIATFVLLRFGWLNFYYLDILFDYLVIMRATGMRIEISSRSHTIYSPVTSNILAILSRWSNLLFFKFASRSLSSGFLLVIFGI